MGEAWADEIARARFERDDFKRRSTAKRKLLAEMRRAGRTRTLEYLEAMSLMHEYAASARDRQAFIDKHKPLTEGNPHVPG